MTMTTWAQQSGGCDGPVFGTQNAYKTQTHHNSLGTLNFKRTAVANVS